MWLTNYESDNEEQHKTLAKYSKWAIKKTGSSYEKKSAKEDNAISVSTKSSNPAFNMNPALEKTELHGIKDPEIKDVFSQLSKSGGVANLALDMAQAIAQSNLEHEYLIHAGIAPSVEEYKIENEPGTETELIPLNEADIVQDLSVAGVPNDQVDQIVDAIIEVNSNPINPN
jgi:hypothetical protein